MNAPAKPARRWYQPGPDEGCMEAALATLLGMPPALLPDLTDQSTDEALDSLEVWAARRNWWVIRHQTPPEDRPSLAISEQDSDGYRHVLVVHGEEPVHDPGELIEAPPGFKKAPAPPTAFALTIERRI